MRLILGAMSCARLCILAGLCLQPGLVMSQDLQSGDPEQRVKAIRELSKQGSPVIARLVPSLKDPDGKVREEAVEAIVRIGTQYSLDPLIEATRDNDPDIQIRATDGLVNFYLPGYVQTGISGSLKRLSTNVKSRFTDTNDQVIDPTVIVRPNVIEALGKLSRGGSSMESRANAARAIGILRGNAAIPDLLQAIRSKDDAVIYESLIALQKIRDISTGPSIAFLLRDLKERVQVAAIETTGLLQNRSALPTLRDVYSRSKSKKVQRMALMAIAMMPEEASRPLYAGAYTNSDEEIRAAALEGFGRLKSERDVPTLERVFNEERKMKPRLAAAFSLVNDGKTELSELSPLQYLVNTLNSKNYQAIAQAYLIELTRDPALRAKLYAKLPSGTRDEKTMMAGVLMRTGERDAIPTLEALSRDGDSDVAQEGLRALGIVKARNP